MRALQLITCAHKEGFPFSLQRLLMLVGQVEYSLSPVLFDKKPAAISFPDPFSPAPSRCLRDFIPGLHFDPILKDFDLWLHDLIFEIMTLLEEIGIDSSNPADTLVL